MKENLIQYETMIARDNTRVTIMQVKGGCFFALVKKLFDEPTQTRWFKTKEMLKAYLERVFRF